MADDKWIFGGTTQGSVMKPLQDFSVSGKSNKPQKEKESGGWEEGGQFDTGKYLDISQTSKSVLGEAKNIDKQLLLSDDSKKNRLTEINQEITKLQTSQKKLSETPLAIVPGGSPLIPGIANQQERKQRQTDMDQMTKKIMDLTKEKNRISEDLKPATDQEKKESLQNYSVGSIDGKIGDYDFIQKYGNRATKIDLAVKQDKMEILNKQKARIEDTDHILSYPNMIYGKPVKLKNVSEDQINSLWNDITKDPEYRKMLYGEKKKFIDKKVSQFISTLDLKQPEGKEPIDKTALKNSILHNLLPKFSLQPDGNPSVEGIKLYAENQLDEVNTILDIYKQALDEKGVGKGTIYGLKEPTDPDAINNYQKLAVQYGEKNVATWYTNLLDESDKLSKTKNKLEKLLDFPEYKHGGLRDIGKAIKSTDILSLVTFGITDMRDEFHISTLAKKVENGEPLNFAEQKQLETYATLNYIHSLGTEGSIYKGITGGINMIPFMAQFALSGGITSGISEMVEGVTSKVTKGILSKGFQFAGKKITLASIAGKSLAAGAQAAAIPQMYLKEMTELARNQIGLINDPTINELTSKIEPGTGVPIGKAIGKAAWDAYSNIFAWNVGDQVMAGLAKSMGKFGEKIIGKDKIQFLKNLTLAKYMETAGIKVTDKQWFKTAKTIGWDGIMSNYTKLFINYYMSGITDPKNLKFPVGKGAGEWWADQFDTFISLASIGAVMKPMEFGQKLMIGKDIKVKGEFGDGEKFDIKIPREIYNEISNVFAQSRDLIGKEGSAKLDEILTKWQGKLDEKQEKFIISQIITLGQEKHAEVIARKARGDEIVDEATGKIYHEEKPEDINLLKFSKEEREDIEKENKRITEEHTDLVKEDLVLRDPESGQLLEPDKFSSTEFLKSINKQLSGKAEFDKRGNVIDPTPEVEKLLDKKVLLEQHLASIEPRAEFKDLTIPEKNDVIRNELKTKTLSGIPSQVTNRKFEVKLDDGRTINAYYNIALSKKQKEAATQAILNNEKVSLKLTPWEEWNPDLSIKDTRGLPYYDKIDVMLGDTPIGSVEVTDFREEASRKLELQRKEAEAKKKISDAFASIAHETMKKVGGLKEVYSSEEQDTLKKAVLDAVKGLGDYTGIQLEKVIDWLKEAVNNLPDLTDKEKNVYYSVIDSSKDKILDYISKQQIKAKGWSKAPVIMSLNDITIPEHEGVNITGPQKMDNMLNSFSDFWKSIADATESNKDNIEKIFYKIAKTGRFQGEVANEAQYKHFLTTLRGTDMITDKITEALEKSSYKAAVSLFNFYSNIHLTKQFGFLVKGKTMQMKLLNPPQNYDQFVDSFRGAVRRYSYKGYQGYEALEKTVRNHTEERDDRFNIKKQGYAWYEQQSPEKREQLRREQHASDVMFLSEITGIPIDAWNDYFSEQTKETFAKSGKDNETMANFGSYDNLLKHDIYRGNYHRIQSNIAFNLGLTTTIIDESGKRITATPEEFVENFEKFFLKGDEDKGVLSNLYKLSTSLKDKDDIALRGIDIKGDRFNSFIQSNHVYTLAKKIRTSPVINDLTKYYFDKNTDPVIYILNGVHDTELNATKKGTPSLNMSSDDLWISQLHAFLQEGDSYDAWMGQFADKPGLYFTDVPKYKIPDEIPKSFIKEFPDFDKATDWVKKNFINNNQHLFNRYIPHIPEGLSDKQKIDFNNQARTDMAKSFVYNFAKNMKDIVEVFHGDLSAYTDLNDLVKRAGPKVSPGYTMNTNIEGGVGETYQFALVHDYDLFDGVEFMTGDWASRAQKSMGSLFSKEDQPGMEFLSSMKACHSTVNPENNLPGLTKGNILNIDLIASVFPDSKYAKLRDFMKENNVDRLSFTSTTKLYEMAKRSKAKEDMAIKLWDKEGNWLKKSIIPENSVISRNTSDTYIQQDLRHPTEAKPAKMASQILANMLALPNGNNVAIMLNAIQNITMDEMIGELNNKRIDQAKLEWLKENVNKNTQADIARLLSMGMTPYEPSLANFMRKMIASHVTRKALEVPINRVTTQEIPDADQLLTGRHTSSDGKHIISSDIASNVEGARYSEFDFLGKPDDAVNHVLMNRDKYRDLFDIDDNLMEWEIRDRDGEIPGEFKISTRIPADDLHAHAGSRLKYKLTGGNFTMLDREGQQRSGSDFDGDQRFNWVYYRDKKGQIVLDNTKEGIANQIMMQIEEDYGNPIMNTKISEPINTKMYDDLVNSLRKKQEQYSIFDPRAWDRARQENMTGVKMKGIMTDIVTVYSLLNGKNIPFKKTIPLGTKGIDISGISKDPKGLMKIHLANLLNMAFDNAKDPKIEIMGLNEITAPMFVLSLFGDKSVDTRTHENIYKQMEKVSEYFTSDLLRDFTSIMRENQGGLKDLDMERIKSDLSNIHPEAEVKKLISFYNDSREIGDIRKFYSLTQKAPNTVVEFQVAKQLYDKVKNNKFSLLDVRNIFGRNGSPISEFAIAEKVLDMSGDILYHDTFEYSPAGREIYQAIYDMLKKREPGRKYMSTDELKSISYGLNSIATLRAIGVQQSMESLQKELLGNLKKYRTEYPSNDFLNTIVKVSRRKKEYIEILPDYQRGHAIGDRKLEKIRNDFDRLHAINPKLADKFAAYAIMRWGAVTSTWRGSYYNLIGDNYRVELSKKVQNELYNWQINDLSPEEKLQVSEWTLRNSRQKTFREMSVVNPEYSNYYDYNSIASIDPAISMENLEVLTQISSMDEFTEYAKDHPIDIDALTEYIIEKTGSPKIKPWARQELEKFRSRANQMFPSDTRGDIPVRSMLERHSVNEMLISEDPELSKFIYDHLKKAYPDVQMFSSREDFMNFVNKFGSRGFNCDPEAIGHAFANATFIDPKRSVQSSQLHEHAHIYWDALSDDNKVKQQLRDLFRQQFKGSIDDIDEQIVLDIGRVATDIAKIQLRGSLVDKFMNLLKQFWGQVKIFFGKTGKEDLIHNLANDVFNNSGKIKASTNYSDALIKNMVTFNDKDENFIFNGETHTHFIGEDPIPSVTSVIKNMQDDKFDPDISSRYISRRFQQEYSSVTGEKLSQKHLDDIARRYRQPWSDNQEKGTILNAIAESVFGNRVITKEERKEFASTTNYYDLINEMRQLKQHYDDMYPNVIWYTDKQIVSKKYRVAGIVDLVADIGDNRLILFDFRPAEYEFGNSDMTPSEKYKSAQSLFKPPFQTLPQSKYNSHLLHTNMFANMLEEQEDPNQPGKFNKVEAIRVIPILRQIDPATQRIVDATIGKNFVNIPRNDKTKELADRMMSYNASIREDYNKIYPEMRANLEKTGMASHLITPTLVAYNFFRQSVPKLSNMNREVIESYRGTEFGFLKTNLFKLGFTQRDIYGDKALPFELLFFNGYHGGLNLTKDELTSMMDTYYPEQEVYAKYKAVPNPEAGPRAFHHLNYMGNDYYLREAGYSDLKSGDDIMMIYDIPRPTGETPRDVYFYNVEKTNPGRGSISVLNQETGRRHEINLPDGNSGALKIYNTLPEHVKEPPRNSYVPRWLYEKEKGPENYERHINYDKITGKSPEKSLTEGEQEKQRHDIRRMWSIFNDMPTLDKAENYANDFDEINDLYSDLQRVSPEIGDKFLDFVREICVNHTFAKSIRDENNFEGIPKEPLPMTLNTYFMLTNNPDAIWKDWDNFAGLRFALPHSLIENQYTPVTIFTSMAENGFRHYNEEQFDLNNIMRKYVNKIDLEAVTISGADGQHYWRFPTESKLANSLLEREFLEQVYKYHERFNPPLAENSIRRRIPVPEVYLSRAESIERWGRKWGPALWERLKPARYDRVRLSVMEFDKNGRMIPFKDRFGKEKIMTLGDIKDQFAMETMNERELREYLGPRWKHIAPRILGTMSIAGKSGLLNYYITKAQRVFKGSEPVDENNIGIHLPGYQRNIPLIGSGKEIHTMSNYAAAEVKRIDSMLFRQYMKPLMAPLDWMVNMYNSTRDGQEKRIADYLRTWGDYILYGRKPKESFLGGEVINGLVNVTNKLNSYNKIMFGFTSQAMNLAIGTGFGVIREPQAYAAGMKRLYIDNFGTGFIKAWNIAKRYGLTNVVDDAVFDQIEKERKIAGVDVKKLEDIGYRPMELAVKAYQFPIFSGLFTDKEWNAYDNKGNIINSGDAPSNYKASMIMSRVQQIHGHYSKISMAPWYVTNWGKALMQFRKYLPTYLWSQISPYHIDRNLTVRSGILPTVNLMGRILLYNNSDVAKRQESCEKAIVDIANKNKFATAEFFSNTREYFDTMISELNGGKVTIKELTPNDKKNLVYLGGQIALLGLSSMIMYSVAAKNGNPDQIKKINTQSLLPLLQRYQGDMLWLYSWQNWSYYASNFIPAMSMLTNGIRFSTDAMHYIWGLVDPEIMKKATYQKDTFMSYEGEPKFAVSATYIAPGGSGIRWVMEKAIKLERKNKMVDLHDLGMDQNEIDQLGLDNGRISEYDIEQNAYRYNKVYEIMKKSAEYDALTGKNYDMNHYYDLVTGADLLKEERTKLKDALNYIAIRKQFGDEKFAEQYREWTEKARMRDDYVDAKQSEFKSVKRRKFSKALQQENK